MKKKIKIISKQDALKVFCLERPGIRQEVSDRLRKFIEKEPDTHVFFVDELVKENYKIEDQIKLELIEQGRDPDREFLLSVKQEINLPQTKKDYKKIRNMVIVMNIVFVVSLITVVPIFLFTWRSITWLGWVALLIYVLTTIWNIKNAITANKQVIKNGKLIKELEEL